MATEPSDHPATTEEDHDMEGDRLTAIEERLEDLESEMAAATTTEKMTIIATKGTLDMAYPPLILASTAAAFDWDVTVFHTFWGLDILHEERSKNLKLSAVGQPSVAIPNLVATIPGMDAMATAMMERKIDDAGTASIEDLIEVSIDSGVELQACQMTMDLMDYEESALYDGVTTGVGAATALQGMADADIQLLV